MGKFLPLLGCRFVWPKSLQIAKSCIVSTVAHHMKEFMEEHEQGIGAPLSDQQSGVKVDHFEVQRPVGFPLPTGRTVPLSGIGTKDTKSDIRKKDSIALLEGKQRLHDLQNIPPQPLEEPLLSEIGFGHKSNLTTSDGRLDVLL